MRSSATIITDYNASTVVGAKDVINPNNALGWEDQHYAILTHTSVMTLSWTFPFKSGIVLFVNISDRTCPYVKIQTSHYATLSSAPITTTELWVSTSNGYIGVGEDFAYENILPLHRYVVIVVNWPIWVDTVFHGMYTNLEIRWMPIIMAQ